MGTDTYGVQADARDLKVQGRSQEFLEELGTWNIVDRSITRKSFGEKTKEQWKPVIQAVITHTAIFSLHSSV